MRWRPNRLFVQRAARAWWVWECTATTAWNTARCAGGDAVTHEGAMFSALAHASTHHGVRP